MAAFSSIWVHPLEDQPMSATKILWGQIIVVCAIVVVTLWAATQWAAWRLGYQPQLGQPWFELWPGVPVYLPPAFFWWWYAYDAYAPRIFIEGAWIAASGGFISIAVPIGMSVWRARETKNMAVALARPPHGVAPGDRPAAPHAR
jgi:type IV secretion system protein VirD4